MDLMDIAGKLVGSGVTMFLFTAAVAAIMSNFSDASDWVMGMWLCIVFGAIPIIISAFSVLFMCHYVIWMV